MKGPALAGAENTCCCPSNAVLYTVYNTLTEHETESTTAAQIPHHNARWSNGNLPLQ